MTSMSSQSEPVWCNLGTSSWLFDGWRGVFYPDKLAQGQYLAHYSRHFNTVEVNTTFYGLPAPATVIGWVNSVPPGFTFALKFPRAISHDKRLADCESETLVFLDVLRSLGSAAAPALLQLPPDFNRKIHGRILAIYLDWLATRCSELRVAVEVRAADLMTPAFANFLAARGFGLTLVDRVGTTDMWADWWMVLEGGNAPPFMFVRWIGDDKHGPQGDRALQVDRTPDLLRWAERIAAATAHGVQVFGYMHNPYEGHAPASVRRLQAHLTAVGVLPTWPPADSIPASNDPTQPSLF